MVEEDIKEVAVVTAYIQSKGLLWGSFFSTIDKSYDIAKEFVKTYPPKNFNGKWGTDGVGEYEEVLDLFVHKYTK